MAGPGKRVKTISAALIASAVIISIAVYFVFLRREEPKDYLVTTGVMEATEVDLTPKIPGRIEWLCCEEGENVKAGGLAIRLESAELEARVEEGRAAVQAAGNALEEARISIEEARLRKQTASFEVEAAEAEVERVSALTDEARENLARANGLFGKGFIPKKDLDAARASYDSSAASLSSARAGLKGAQAMFRNADVEIKASEARMSSAGARKKQAEAQSKVLQTVLSDTRIASPIDGVVAYRAFETGEFVNTGAAVYTVYDLNDIWARVDIEETRIHGVRLGASAEVRVAGIPGKVFKAKVTEIGEAGGFATQRDVTRGRPDIKTFRVKARIEDPRGFLKPGMTVEVRIYHGGGEQGV